MVLNGDDDDQTIKEGKEKAEEGERERQREGIFAEEEQSIFGFCLCFGAVLGGCGPPGILGNFYFCCSHRADCGCRCTLVGLL